MRYVAIGADQKASVTDCVQLITLLNAYQAIKPLQGYKSPVWKQIVFAACMSATLGASGLLAKVWPTFMTLLRLQACSVTEASYVKCQVT